MGAGAKVTTGSGRVFTDDDARFANWWTQRDMQSS
jgi:hypothetical protein